MDRIYNISIQDLAGAGVVRGLIKPLNREQGG